MNGRTRPVPRNSKTTTESSSLPSRGRSCQNEDREGRGAGAVVVLIAEILPAAADTGTRVSDVPPGYLHHMLTPKARGALSEALFESMRARPRALPARRRPGEHGTTRSPCGPSTSCTTAASTTSTTRSSGTPTCSRCAATWRRRFEGRLRERWRRRPTCPTRASVRRGLLRLVEGHDGASLGRATCSATPTPSRCSTCCRLRSVYHLKEADPAAWVVPRLRRPRPRRR